MESGQAAGLARSSQLVELLHNGNRAVTNGRVFAWESFVWPSTRHSLMDQWGLDCFGQTQYLLDFSHTATHKRREHTHYIVHRVKDTSAHTEIVQREADDKNRALHKLQPVCSNAQQRNRKLSQYTWLLLFSVCSAGPSW